MNEPLISVVLTLGGGVQRMRTALESLQTQTYRNWEAVLVDGSLAPDAREGVELLAREECRLRLIHDPAADDRPAARNAAVQKSRGEWIAFLDSAERFLPHSLAVRLETARADALLVVHSDGYEMNADEPTTIGVPPLAGRVYRDLLEQQGPLFPGLLIHSSAMTGCGYLDRRLEYFQDWDLSIRLAHSHRFGFEVVPTFVSDHHRAASSATGPPARAKEYERVLRKHGLAMLQHGGAPLLRRHYRAVAESYDHAGKPTAAARCRAMAFVCGWADPARFLGKARRLWSWQPRRQAHARFVQRSHLEPAEVSLRLSELLRVPVGGLSAEFSEGQSGNVHRVDFRDASEMLHTVVLKRVDTAFEYDFYRQVLEPLALDAPKIHGHVETSTGRFLVMDYIAHEPSRWADYDNFRTAVRWLAKKDMIVHERFKTVLATGLLPFAPDRPPLVATIEAAIAIIRKGVERKVSPLVSPLLLQALVQRRRLLHELAADIFRKSRLTVCHRDFHLKNVLFPVANPASVYVIDWSNPEIDSVCVDLARLVLVAPPAIRSQLVDLYRSLVDFDQFEERYRQTELVMTLVQFAWSLSVVLEGRREPLTAAEVRKARTLQRRLVEQLRIGLTEAVA